MPCDGGLDILVQHLECAFAPGVGTPDPSHRSEGDPSRTCRGRGWEVETRPYELVAAAAGFLRQRGGLVEEVEGGQQPLGVLPAGGTVPDVGHQLGVAETGILTTSHRLDVLIQYPKAASRPGLDRPCHAIARSAAWSCQMLRVSGVGERHSKFAASVVQGLINGPAGTVEPLGQHVDRDLVNSRGLEDGRADDRSADPGRRAGAPPPAPDSPRSQRGGAPIGQLAPHLVVLRAPCCRQAWRRSRVEISKITNLHAQVVKRAAPRKSSSFLRMFITASLAACTQRSSTSSTTRSGSRESAPAGLRPCHPEE